jgi:hypothetical protein
VSSYDQTSNAGYGGWSVESSSRGAISDSTFRTIHLAALLRDQLLACLQQSSAFESLILQLSADEFCSLSCINWKRGFLKLRPIESRVSLLKLDSEHVSHATDRKPDVKLAVARAGFRFRENPRNEFEVFLSHLVSFPENENGEGLTKHSEALTYGT